MLVWQRHADVSLFYLLAMWHCPKKHQRRESNASLLSLCHCSLSLLLYLSSKMTAATASMVSQAAFNQSKPSLALKTQLAFSSNLSSTPSSNILNSVSPFLVFINLSVHKIYMQVFLKCFFLMLQEWVLGQRAKKGL